MEYDYGRDDLTSKVSWRQYKMQIQQKEVMKKEEERRRRKQLQKKIKVQQLKDEEKRRDYIGHLHKKNVNRMEPYPRKQTQLANRKQAYNQDTRGKKEKVQGQNKTDSAQPAKKQGQSKVESGHQDAVLQVKHKPDHQDNKLSDISSPRINPRKKMPPFTSKPTVKMYSPTKSGSGQQHLSRKLRPLAGDEPVTEELGLITSARSEDLDPLLMREVEKSRRYGHVRSRVYDYHESPRYQSNLRETMERVSTKKSAAEPTITKKSNTEKKYSSKNIFEYRENEKMVPTFRPNDTHNVSDKGIFKGYDKKQRSHLNQRKFQIQEEMYIPDDEMFEIESTTYDSDKIAKRKYVINEGNVPYESVNYMYDERWKQHNAQQDMKKIIKTPRREQAQTIGDTLSNDSQKPKLTLPSVNNQKAIPSTPESFKSADLSHYTLPPIGHKVEDDYRQTPEVSQQGEAASPSKHTRHYGTDRKSDVGVGKTSHVTTDGGSADASSISTIPLGESASLKRNPSGKKKQYNIQTRTENNIWTSYDSLPNQTHDSLEEPPDSKRKVYTDSTTDDHSQEYLMARSNIHQDHRSWPIYKVQRGSSIACLVRTAPSSLEDFKQCLELEDSLPEEIGRKLPSMPPSDFDTYERIELSPMMLVWNHPQKQFYTFGEPFYLYMPINTDVYNDVLQQMTFLFTVDLLRWRRAECKMVHMPVDGQDFDFLEILINDPFKKMVFDIKARYKEDIYHVQDEGVEIRSTMEPDVRLAIGKRTFDSSAVVKLRIEPLDMNETDLKSLIPTQTAVRVVAVSPILKITASEPTKRPLMVYVPKPGYTVFGSTKLGLRCKISDVRGAKVSLYIKEKKVSKYQPDSCLSREFANEYEFTVTLWKPWSSCYCFLVLEGQETGRSIGNNGDFVMDDLGLTDVEGGFLTLDFLKRLSVDMEKDDLKVASLGKLLINTSTTDYIMSTSEKLDLVSLRVFKRWRNANIRKGEGTMVRKLVACLKESGFRRESSFVQNKYSSYVIKGEANRMLAFFEELKRCPSVLVNWRSLGGQLGLSGTDIALIQRERRDVRHRCAAMLLKLFEQLKLKLDFHRDILLEYIDGLRTVGLVQIASSVEHRHLPKFYVNIS